MNTKQLPEEVLKKDFPDLAEAMAAHCITTTVPDEPNGQPLVLWVMPIGQVVSWMKIANKQAISTATQQAREEERAKALEIARSCVINRKVGSPCPLVITEKMYEQVLKVGMTGVEALSKKGA